MAIRLASLHASSKLRVARNHASWRSLAMRTSRVSRDTTNVLTAISVAEPIKTRTRSSLSRFAQNASPKTKDEVKNEPTHLPDIEDALDSRLRKRKRTMVESPVKRGSSQKAAKIKTEVEESTRLSTSPSTERRVRKPARQIKNEETGEVEIHPPNDWEEVYALVKKMRTSPGGAARNAAVDTMGCESLAADDADERDKRYHTLTALMLSSQTKDTTNALAMRRLQTELPPHSPSAPPGLNLKNILAVAPEVLNELIWAVGFHNNKTRYIKAAALILRDNFDSDVPDTVEGLMSLPGVGPKMAYLCMSAAWGRTEGIGVDVHVHRITNLWGWHGGSGTKGPEETRIALQRWLPRELWHEINWMLVGLGQTVCLPVGRKCGECEVGLEGLCRSAERGKVVVGRRAREVRLKVEAEGQVVEKQEIMKEEVLVEHIAVNAAPDAMVKVEGDEF